jgi:CRP-like cAMP-binding protein
MDVRIATVGMPLNKTLDHPLSATGTPSSSSLLLTEDMQTVGGMSSLFKGLSVEERKLVISHGHRKVFHRGKTLFRQGLRHEGIFLIENGSVRVFYTAPSRREITLAYWYPGNFVGGPEIFGFGVYSWSGVAATDSTVFQLPGQDLRKLLREIPGLATGLIEGLAFKGKCYSALAQMLGTRSITERLVQLLLHLVEHYGVDHGDGILINADFTYADLAHMVGGTRQWVTISIKRLQQNGIISSCHSKIVVRRTDLLRSMRGT